MRSGFDTLSVAGGVLGAGLTAPWLVVAHQLFAPDLLHWIVALGFAVLTGFAGGVAGLRATINPDSHARLHSRRVLIAIAVGPVGSTLVAVVAGLVTDASVLALLAATAASVVLCVVGTVGLRRLSVGLYETRIGLSESIELPGTVRHRLLARCKRYLGAVLAVAGVAALYWWTVTGERVPLYLVGLAVLLVVPRPDRGRAITDAGLRRGVAVRPWTEFESFRLEGGHLVVDGSGPVLDRYRFDRAAIADEQRIRTALSCVLDER